MAKTGMWAPIGAAALSLLVPASAGSQNGMWGYAIHVCRGAGQCTEGVMNQADTPRFVSKAKCEDGAHELVNGLQRLGLVIKYVRCVQL
jgi:hypothetical protein